MADDIRRLRHKAAEIDDAIDTLLEVYTREEIDEKFTEIFAKIDGIEARLTARETPAEEADSEVI